MTTGNQESEIKRISLAMHPSISEAIAEIAIEENRSFSSQLRCLVHKGLEGYGLKVRGNKIVAESLPAG